MTIRKPVIIAIFVFCIICLTGIFLVACNQEEASNGELGTPNAQEQPSETEPVTPEHTDEREPAITERTPQQTDNSEGSSPLHIELPVLEGTAENVTFELTATTLLDHDRMMVYKNVPPDVTLESVAELGKRLGLNDAPYKRRDKIAVTGQVNHGTSVAIVSVNSGGIEYNAAGTEGLYPSTKQELPSDEEAKQIAIDFLAESGLMPPEEEIGELSVKTGGSAWKARIVDGEIVEEYTSHLLVHVPRLIDGFPVGGAGAKFGLRIGAGGEVLRLLMVWREVEPYQEMEIKTAQQAYHELEEIGIRYTPSGCEKVIVDEVSLGYWMEPMDAKQEYVVPVYVFEGEGLDESGEVVDPDFIGWVEALNID
ncbi:MAG: hypothetical protein R6U89_04960 [Dehalococcoidia bacterium]